MAIRVVEFSNGGTKLERFILRINILKGKYQILRIGLMGRHCSGRCQKLGIILENQVHTLKMLLKNVNHKKCAPKLILFNVKEIENDSNNF